jgi:hypothetical protein
LHGDIPPRPGDILAIASGGGVVALRAIRLDSVGFAPTLTLTTDAKATARRGLVAVYNTFRRAERRMVGASRETFIILVRGHRNASAATAELAGSAPTDSMGPAYWRAGAHFPQGNLLLTRARMKRGTIFPASIDGVAVHRMPLGIDGDDVGASIRQQLAC